MKIYPQKKQPDEQPAQRANTASFSKDDRYEQ